MHDHLVTTRGPALGSQSGPSHPTWAQMFLNALPEKRAVVTQESEWSGNELLDRASAAASWLDSIGVPDRGPVPALLTSRAESFALFLGAMGSGRHLAPLGPRLSQRELVASVAAMDAPVIVAEEGTIDAARRVATATGKRAEVLPTLLSGTAHPLDFDVTPDDVALTLHTSGTSGLPKPIPFRQDRMAVRTHINGSLMGLGHGMTYASGSPFHHAAGLGMFVVALGSGATAAAFPAFTVEAWKELETREVTHALLVPTMIEILLQVGALNLPTLRMLQYGSAPIHPDTLHRVLLEMPHLDLIQMFGQTEGSPITCLTPQDHRDAASGRHELLRSIGRAAPNTEIHLEAPNTVGEGEIVARGSHLYKVDDQGWLHTGDIGHIDHDGYVYLRGRMHDMILRSGEKVYPLQVEQALMEHTRVLEVAVIGVEDRRHGQLVKAVIAVDEPLPDDDARADLIAELTAFARDRLAPFTVPTEWDFVDALPRNSVGKVVRSKLT